MALRPKKPKQGGGQQTPKEKEEVVKQALEKAREEMMLEMLEQMRKELSAALVHDTVIEAEDVRVILTMSSEFLTPSAAEQLRAGSFTALGKVTRVLAEDEVINLTRRTVLGISSSLSQQVLGDFKSEEFDVDVGDPVVASPAFQLLPLAVFI